MALKGWKEGRNEGKEGLMGEVERSKGREGEGREEGSEGKGVMGGMNVVKGD